MKSEMEQKEGVMYQKIAQTILEQYGNIAAYGKEVGISEYCLCKKLKGETSWDIFDIENFSDACNVPVNHIKDYFGDFVPKKGAFVERLLKYFGTISGASKYIGCDSGHLDNVLWNGIYSPGDVIEPICNMLEIDTEDFFEKEETLVPVFYYTGRIKVEDMEGLAKKMNMPLVKFEERVEGYVKWTPEELEKLKEILNIKRLSDFIDDDKFSKTEIVYEYRLRKQEKKKEERSRMSKNKWDRIRYIDGVKHARFSTVYDAESRTVIQGYEKDFLPEFLRDVERFCITSLWDKEMFRERTKAKDYEAFKKHIYVQFIPLTKQERTIGEMVWKYVAVR